MLDRRRRDWRPMRRSCTRTCAPEGARTPTRPTNVARASRSDGETSRRASRRRTSSSSASSPPGWCTRATSSRTRWSRRPGEDGHSVVWCCTQGPFVVRAYCARLLGLDPSQIRVIPSEIGGGFGGKTTIYHRAARRLLLSRRAGRPVKMVMTREEVFRATGPTSGTRIRVKIGATRDGQAHRGRRRLRSTRPGRFTGSPVGAGVDDDVRALRARARPHRGLRRRREQAEGRRLSRARVRRWPRSRSSR